MVIPAYDGKTACYRVYVEFVWNHITAPMCDSEREKVAVFWRKGPTLVAQYDGKVMAELDIGKKFHSTQGRAIEAFFLKLDNAIYKAQGNPQ